MNATAMSSGPGMALRQSVIPGAVGRHPRAPGPRELRPQIVVPGRGHDHHPSTQKRGEVGPYDGIVVRLVHG